MSADSQRPFARLAPGQLRAMRNADAYGFTRIEEDVEDTSGGMPPPTMAAVEEGVSPSGGGTSQRLLKIFRQKGSQFESISKAYRETNAAGTFEPEQLRKAASKIQRWYRGVHTMYSAFGPMMFSCKDGRMADFGSVSYLSGTRAAKWIRVSDSTSVVGLSHFLEKFWRLPRPDVLISVTGSAASLQLTSTLQRVFDRGLATAAAMTNAWIFTGTSRRSNP